MNGTRLGLNAIYQLGMYVCVYIRYACRYLFAYSIISCLFIKT